MADPEPKPRQKPGRKPGGPGSSRIPKLVKVEPEIWATVEDEARATKRTRSDVVNDRLRQAEKTKPRS